MFERFNNLPPMNYNPYDYNSGYNSPYDQVPYRTPSYYNNGYIANVNNEVPEPAVGNTTEDNLYPWQSSSNTPFLNNPVPYGNTAVNNGYAQGGQVTNRQKFPEMAEILRNQGRYGDTMLAHINPVEAQLLAEFSGGSSINPDTHLQEFWPKHGFFAKPFKAIKGGISNTLSYGVGGHLLSQLLPKKQRKGIKSFGEKYVIPAGAAMLGNTILPGIGGAVGGSLGGALGAKLGNRNTGEGAVRGGIIGALLPSAASLAGSGASAIGATNVGSALSNYGTQNALLPSIGNLFGINSGTAASTLGGTSASSPMSSSSLSSPAITANSGSVAGAVSGNTQQQGFLDSLLSNSKDFFSQPSNLLATAILGSSFLNRPKKPKEKTPEQLGDEQKRYQKALMLTPEELLAKEKQLLADEHMKRRVSRQKFLPEERLGPIEPLYVKTHTPEEYKKKGNWLSYYNNPQFSGQPLLFKEGGEARIPDFLEIEEMDYPSDKGIFFEGIGGGQDDDRRFNPEEDGYFVDASVVSNLGDGNSRGGANKLDALVSDGEYYYSPQQVTKIGKGSNNRGVKLLDTLVKNVRKHKGGSTKLPPKAKSINTYMRGKYA